MGSAWTKPRRRNARPRVVGGKRLWCTAFRRMESRVSPMASCWGGGGRPVGSNGARRCPTAFHRRPRETYLPARAASKGISYLHAGGNADMTRFSPVTDRVAAELARICGESNVTRDPSRLARYSRDQVPEKRYHS